MTASGKTLVAIVMGSKSDWEVMQHAPETLAELGIDDPFDLSGVYHGVDIGRKSSTDSGALPDRIILYRRAILDEWAAGDVTLERLVHHILIHEVGHHFGLSDDDMHLLEQDG